MPRQYSPVVQSTVYDHETVKRALLTLAICGGNSIRAEEMLKEAGHPVPSRTIRLWREGKYADLYCQLHDKHGQEIEKALIPELREGAIRAARASHQAIEEAERLLALGEIKDPAGAARNLATTSAVLMDKLYLATDRPTEVRPDLDPLAILERLSKRAAAVEGTAEEVPPETSESAFLPAGTTANAPAST